MYIYFDLLRDDFSKCVCILSFLDEKECINGICAGWDGSCVLVVVVYLWFVELDHVLVEVYPFCVACDNY